VYFRPKREAQRVVSGRVEALLRDRVDLLESLSRLSSAVARAPTLEDTYTAALDCLAETLSPDRASVLLFDDEGVMRWAAWRGLSDEYRQATEGHTPWTRETRDPAPVLIQDVAAEPELGDLSGVIEAEGIRSLAFFPLLGGDRLLGKFMVYFDTPHVFEPTEVRLAQAIGTHIALEIGRRQAEDKLRLAYQAEYRARNVAERLQLVTDALARAMTTAEIAEVVVREGAGALGAAAGWLAIIDDDRRELRRLAALGYRTELESAYSVLPLDLDNPTVRAVVDQRALWFESGDEVIQAYPELRRDYPLTGFEAMAVVPLLVRDHARGVIALNFTERRAFRKDERRLLTALAAQCGPALERASLYALAQDRADAASVLAHVGDGVFQLDPYERITLWNRGAEVITDVAAADAVGRRIGEVMGGWAEIRPRISITEVPLAFGRREALPVELQGRELWLAISGVETGDGVVYAFRDVTEAEKLEKARRDFLSTASHELRTPLAGVFGATKTLLNRELDPQTARALLEIIDRESERLGRILDEILFASRLDADRVDVEIESCDIVQLAREVLELQTARASEGLTFRFDAPPWTPRVAADPNKLRQVLLNLVDNAIKYSPAGGQISVSLGSHDHVVRLTVADQGLGIPGAEHERIFEKFYRLDPELSRGVGGTGLGLYISREFVKLMNARIWLESAEGEGSAFHVELPTAD
jgi:signal transduction histidine kinase